MAKQIVGGENLISGSCKKELLHKLIVGLAFVDNTYGVGLVVSWSAAQA